MPTTDKYEVRLISHGLEVHRLKAEPHPTGSIIIQVPRNIQGNPKDVLRYAKHTVRSLNMREVTRVLKGAPTIHATLIQEEE